MRFRPHEDAIGQAVRDQFLGREAYELIEREDGFVDLTQGPLAYLAPYAAWTPHVRRIIREARGRVLDIGCNAGRHAIYLQGRGHDVLGIDVSPLAIDTARRRGLARARVLPITGAHRIRGRFDTVLMLGNNFGLFANAARARWLLRGFKRRMSEEARIVTESLDIYQTEEPVHLAYQRENRRRGRMSGQIRFRVRYKQYATPWFDYLMVSKVEMESLVAGTGWRVSRYYDSDGPGYGAVLERD
jgi:SAM-dependent methyltransferase